MNKEVLFALQKLPTVSSDRVKKDCEFRNQLVATLNTEPRAVATGSMLNCTDLVATAAAIVAISNGRLLPPLVLIFEYA